MAVNTRSGRCEVVKGPVRHYDSKWSDLSPEDRRQIMWNHLFALGARGIHKMPTNMIDDYVNSIYVRKILDYGDMAIRYWLDSAGVDGKQSEKPIASLGVINSFWPDNEFSVERKIPGIDDFLGSPNITEESKDLMRARLYALRGFPLLEIVRVHNLLSISQWEATSESDDLSRSGYDNNNMLISKIKQITIEGLNFAAHKILDALGESSKVNVAIFTPATFLRTSSGLELTDPGLSLFSVLIRGLIRGRYNRDTTRNAPVIKLSEILIFTSTSGIDKIDNSVATGLWEGYARELKFWKDVGGQAVSLVDLRTQDGNLITMPRPYDGASETWTTFSVADMKSAVESKVPLGFFPWRLTVATLIKR